MNELEERVERLLQEQSETWDLVQTNYNALANVQTRVLQINGRPVELQLNKERIRSSAANVDAKSLQARPCFFCNRPEKQSSTWYMNDFEILVNPYPIFEDHLTIPLIGHEKQTILPYYEDLLSLASDLPGFVVFYNGPACGASAPDHMHFQAAKKGSLPIEWNYEKTPKGIVWEGKHASLYAFTECLPSAFMLESTDMSEAVDIFHRLCAQMETKEGEDGPRMNVVCWVDGNFWCTIIYPRAVSRPACFFAEGEANILISPAAVEMAGLFVVPLEKDFLKVTAADLAAILKEVSITEEEQKTIIRKFIAGLA